MADRIDATMQRNQSAAANPAQDQPFSQAGVHKLPPGDNPMLLLRQLPHHPSRIPPKCNALPIDISGNALHFEVGLAGKVRCNVFPSYLIGNALHFGWRRGWW